MDSGRLPKEGLQGAWWVRNWTSIFHIKLKTWIGNGLEFLALSPQSVVAPNSADFRIHCGPGVWVAKCFWSLTGLLKRHPDFV